MTIHQPQPLQLYIGNTSKENKKTKLINLFIRPLYYSVLYCLLRVYMYYTVLHDLLSGDVIDFINFIDCWLRLL